MFESLRGHLPSAGSPVGIPFLVAMCLVLALAVWPPAVARAAPPDGCIAGLPPDLATQLQPLIQALSEASGQSMDCASSIPPDVSGQNSPSQRRQELELIAETLALLAMADPGYGYSAPGYGYPAPGYGYSSTPPPAVPATSPALAPATPPGDPKDSEAEVSATCGSVPDSPPSGSDSQ